MRWFSITAILLALLVQHASAECLKHGSEKPILLEIKSKHWKLPDAQRETLAMELSECLGDPDPELRDGIAYEGLTAWLRAKELSVGTRQALYAHLITMLQTPDQQGFSQPFAALMLSELARADRIEAFLTPSERQNMLEAISSYLTNLHDYRGFDSKQGWRHGVAHSADVLREFARRPDLSQDQLDLIRTALASQIAPSEHAYIYGEGERFAYPVFFATARPKLNAHEIKAWQLWLQALATKLDAQKTESEQALWVSHNLKGFFLPLYVLMREHGTFIQRKQLLPVVWKIIQKLP